MKRYNVREIFQPGMQPGLHWREGVMTERRRRKEWNGIERPDGTRIRWSAGEGERPILLVPGFGGDGDCWGTAFPRQLSSRGSPPWCLTRGGWEEAPSGVRDPPSPYLRRMPQQWRRLRGFPRGAGVVHGSFCGGGVSPWRGRSLCPNWFSAAVQLTTRGSPGKRPDLFRQFLTGTLLWVNRPLPSPRPCCLLPENGAPRSEGPSGRPWRPPSPPMVKGSGDSRPPWRNARPWRAGLVPSPCPSWW